MLRNCPWLAGLQRCGLRSRRFSPSSHSISGLSVQTVFEEGERSTNNYMRRRREIKGSLVITNGSSRSRPTSRSSPVPGPVVLQDTDMQEGATSICDGFTPCREHIQRQPGSASGSAGVQETSFLSSPCLPNARAHRQSRRFQRCDSCRTQQRDGGEPRPSPGGGGQSRPTGDRAPALEVCASNLFLVLGKIRQAGCDSPEAVHWS